MPDSRDFGAASPGETLLFSFTWHEMQIHNVCSRMSKDGFLNLMNIRSRHYYSSSIYGCGKLFSRMLMRNGAIKRQAVFALSH